MKGLAFTDWSILRIAEGRKTQTRRILKPPAPWDSTDEGLDIQVAIGNIVAPYAPGDRLYCKEALGVFNSAWGPLVQYRADHTPVVQPNGRRYSWEWKRDVLPAIFMPKWAARYWLEVIRCWPEKLMGISDADITAEGITQEDRRRYPKDWPWRAYQVLWDSLHGNGAWAKSPWVWATEFRRVEGE